jgi:hypothetical protein
MKTEDFQKEQELARMIRDVYAESARMARTHKDHLQAMARVWEHRYTKQLQQYRRHALRSLDGYLLHELHHHGFASTPEAKRPPLLCWVLVGTDGKRFGPGNDDWLKESAEYKVSMQGSHVWADRWAQGEFYPW